MHITENSNSIPNSSSNLSQALTMHYLLATWTQPTYFWNCPSFKVKRVSHLYSASVLSQFPATQQSLCSSVRLQAYTGVGRPWISRWSAFLTASTFPGRDIGQAARNARCKSLASYSFTNPLAALHHPQKGCKRSTRAQWASANHLANCHGPIWTSTACVYWRSWCWWSHQC